MHSDGCAALYRLKPHLLKLNKMSYSSSDGIEVAFTVKGDFIIMDLFIIVLNFD